MATATQLFDTGQGATALFTTNSTFTPKIKEIPRLKRMGGALESSILATTGDKEYVPNDLVENDVLAIPFFFNTNDVFPPIHTVDTFTITWAIRTGQTSATTLVMTVIIEGFEITGHKLGELQEGVMYLKPDGYTGPTLTQGS